MIKALTNGCTKLMQKYLPDAFVFALLLSALVFILGIGLTHQSPMQMLVHWGNGFWGLLAFMMQMVLIVVLGGVVARTPLVAKVIERLASIPKTPTAAIILVTVASGVACMIQWGFALVFMGILAKEVAKKVRGVDYPLLVASGYSTYILTVLTNSIPMKAASNPEELLAQTSGVLENVIPLSATAHHPATLIAVAIMFVTLPILNAKMQPSKEKTRCIDPALLVDEAPTENVKPRSEMTVAEKLENSRIIAIIAGICGVAYIVWYFAIAKKSMDINMMNFLLFTVGLVLHGSPMNFIKATLDSVRSCANIMVQFPFYAGIMGMLSGANAAGVSLAAVISNGIVSVASAHSFPMLTFLSAAIVNMFVPSAGGQWAVQAPVMFPAAKALGANYALTTMSICWGDAWTNTIQPFWALPALGIAKLGARDIMGYMVPVLIWQFIIITASILLWTFVFA